MTSTASGAVEICGLRVDRGGRRVLHDLDVTVARGSVTGLLGPSGCGKTTLLRAIVGVQRIEAGDVRVLGRPAGTPELRDRVAYVTQSPSVYPDLSVSENLRYFAEILGAPRGDPARVVCLVGLAGREHDPMNLRCTLATTRRVLAQLRRDPRTVALMLVVPCVLITLLRYVFDGRPQVFDRVGPPMLGVFPLTVMFVVTAVATLRERTSGTLERLLSMPLGRLDLLLGYGLAFGLVALAQAGLVVGLAVGLLGLHIAGPVWGLLAVALANGLLGTALGLLVSAFAATEFQAVQFLPAFLLPQLLLCGLFTPRAAMAPFLSGLSDALPLSYAVDAMERLTRHPGFTGAAAVDLLVVLGCALVALALGAATLRRRTA